MDEIKKELDKFYFDEIDDWHFAVYIDDDEMIDIYVIDDIYIVRHECDFSSESFKFDQNGLIAYFKNTFDYLYEED